MIIIAAGDSFVWGNELSDSLITESPIHSKKTFSALLATGAEYVCVAYPGYNNNQIAESVKATILKNDNSNVGVIVTWTFPVRSGKYDNDEEITDLEYFLNARQVPYMFTCVDNCIITRNLDYSNWFLFPTKINSNGSLGFYQWALGNKYDIGPQRHPLEQAHKDASILMQGKFNELVKKHIQSH